MITNNILSGTINKSQQNLYNKFTSCVKCKTKKSSFKDSKYISLSISKKGLPPSTEPLSFSKSSRQFVWSSFNYPFKSCINNNGDCNILFFLYDKQICLSKKELLDINAFGTVYYQKVDKQKDWSFIIKRKDGIFVYFWASCDHTGFDYLGNGYISYSDEWFTFYDNCLDIKGRQFLGEG